MKIKLRILCSGIFVLGVAACSKAQFSSAASSNYLTEKSVNVYLGTLENTESVSLRFYDKEEQIPYIAMTDAFRIRKALFDTGFTYETPFKSKYELSKDGSAYTVKLNGRGTATFDVGKKTFLIPNLALLQAYSYNDAPNDILCMDATSSSIHYVTHQKKKDGSVRGYSYPGRALEIPLNEYNIPIYEDGGTAYIPLDLFNNFFLSYTYNNFVYNGDAVYALNLSLGSSQEYLTSFWSGSNGKKKRSSALAEFSYNSLMLNLNYQYGLKQQHHFGDFRKEFADTGWASYLKSTSEQEYIKGLYEIIYNAFGDGHCSFAQRGTYSSSEDLEAVNKSFSDYNAGYVDLVSSYYKTKQLREAAVETNPDYGKAYWESDRTAYIRFDKFSLLSKTPDYYSVAPTEDATDAFGLISYANKRIKANSDIRDVVIDLATNTGGEEPALIFVLGWLLGDDARVNMINPNTNCSSTIYYNADVNLDGKYDVKDDTLEGYGKYILTSNTSFSCGNALPCLAKESGKVKIIGQTSGGGTCQVFPLITTDGTVINISGGAVLSYEKNSHYSDIDDGATPDYVVADTAKIFDRYVIGSVISSFFC